MPQIIPLTEKENLVLEIIKQNVVPVKPEAHSDKVSYRIRNISKIVLTQLRKSEGLKSIKAEPIKKAVRKLETLGFLRKIARTKAAKTKDKNLLLYEFQPDFANKVKIEIVKSLDEMTFSELLDDICEKPKSLPIFRKKIKKLEEKMGI